jgi:hypothetical protein
MGWAISLQLLQPLRFAALAHQHLIAQRIDVYVGAGLLGEVAGRFGRIHDLSG